MRDTIKALLEALTITREYAQVLDPSDANSEMPKLFIPGSVVTVGESTSVPIEWYYIDQYKVDTKGNLAPETERISKKSVPAIRVELKCTINPQILRAVR